MLYDSAYQLTGNFSENCEGVIFCQFEDVNLKTRGLLQFLKKVHRRMDPVRAQKVQKHKNLKNTSGSIITTDDPNGVPWPKDSAKEMRRVFMIRCSSEHAGHMEALKADLENPEIAIEFYRYFYHYEEFGDTVQWSSVKEDGTTISNAKDYIKNYTVGYASDNIGLEFLKWLCTLFRHGRPSRVWNTNSPLRGIHLSKSRISGTRPSTRLRRDFVRWPGRLPTQIVPPARSMSSQRSASISPRRIPVVTPSATRAFHWTE